MEVWVRTIEDTCDKTSHNLRQSRIERHCGSLGGTQPEDGADVSIASWLTLRVISTWKPHNISEAPHGIDFGSHPVHETGFVMMMQQRIESEYRILPLRTLSEGQRSVTHNALTLYHVNVLIYRSVSQILQTWTRLRSDKPTEIKLEAAETVTYRADSTRPT